MHKQADKATALCALLFAVLASAGPLSDPALAQDAQDQLDEKRSRLEATKQEAGVRSETLQTLSGQIDQLTARVAAIRAREAEVQDELDEVEARLDAAQTELRVARKRLEHAVQQLEDQLVAIYKSDGPNMLAVILDSDGYDDMLGRTEYLSSIQTQGESITTRVRELRDQKLATVEAIRSAKVEIAAKEAELERARTALETEEARLEAVRERQQEALARTKTQITELEGQVGALEDKVEAQIQAAQAAEPIAAVSGPVQNESSSGLIWPIGATLTSPFGPRWGRMHEGIDLGAAEGTPIQAATSGTVIMAGYNGGYGNYTCIDHGGGLSSCYAHQSTIGVNVGQEVSQGDIIGEVGNTGASTGAHLHFETRINGAAEDPLGYL